MKYKNLSEIPDGWTVRAEIPLSSVKEIFAEHGEEYCIRDYLGLSGNECKTAKDCEECLVHAVTEGCEVW